MRPRIGMLPATAVVISVVLGACWTRTASEEDDKKAAINVVLAHELACQTYDFDKLDSLHTPDARVQAELRSPRGDYLHLPRLLLPRRWRPSDQLPLTTIHATHARLRIRRERAGHEGLQACSRREIQVLLVWRLHVCGVMSPPRSHLPAASRVPRRCGSWAAKIRS